MRIIEKLVEAYKSRLPDFDEFMNEGASYSEIDHLIESVDQELPASYVELLYNYNGEKTILNTMGGYSLLSLEQVEMQWRLFSAKDRSIRPKEIFQEGKIQPLLYHRNRIPFAHDGSGNFLCIDFYPDIKGEIGQIIYLPTGNLDPVSVIFKNFEEFVEFLIEALESSLFTFRDERRDWSQEDWHMAEIYFYNTWRNDWVDLAESYNERN